MMATTTTLGLLQNTVKAGPDATPLEHRAALLPVYETYLRQAKAQGVEVFCFQELMTGPYFAPSQDPVWYQLAERVPDGPTIQWAMAWAKQLGMVLIVPVYEEEMPGLYYNTAAVIDADGRYVGKYRKSHLPQVAGFWEKFFFRPGNLGYPVFDTAVGKIGVYICYDRHFPEGARALGLAGAELVFNPSATVAGLSESLWTKEQVGHAIANGYFVAAINRVGWEDPWRIGQFYGSSYVVDPFGEIVAQASREAEELLVVTVDRSKVRQARDLWQFYRDRRPETYGTLISP